MTVRELIVALQSAPQDAEVVAGEFVSPSQIGVPVVEFRPDSINPCPRVHVFAPKAEIWQEDE